MKRTDITALLPDIDKDVLDKIMDLNGADITKARGDLTALQGQLSAAQTELEALKARPAGDSAAAEIQALRDELAGLKTANALRELREKVSKDTGVPASLLTGDTEEACKTQAEAIKSFAGGSGYPRLPDGGESRVPNSTATRDKFAEWFNENMS